MAENDNEPQERPAPQEVIMAVLRKHMPFASEQKLGEIIGQMMMGFHQHGISMVEAEPCQLNFDVDENAQAELLSTPARDFAVNVWVVIANTKGQQIFEAMTEMSHAAIRAYAEIRGRLEDPWLCTLQGTEVSMNDGHLTLEGDVVRVPDAMLDQWIGKGSA